MEQITNNLSSFQPTKWVWHVSTVEAPNTLCLFFFPWHALHGANICWNKLAKPDLENFQRIGGHQVLDLGTHKRVLCLRNLKTLSSDLNFQNSPQTLLVQKTIDCTSEALQVIFKSNPS